MFFRSRYLFILIALILASSSVLSACGQKGPLIVPDKTSQTVNQPTN